MILEIALILFTLGLTGILLSAIGLPSILLGIAFFLFFIAFRFTEKWFKIIWGMSLTLILGFFIWVTHLDLWLIYIATAIYLVLLKALFEAH